MIDPFFVVGLVFFAISLTAIAFEEPERRSFFMVTASLSILVMVLSVCVMIERETQNQTPQYTETWECVEEKYDYRKLSCIIFEFDRVNKGLPVAYHFPISILSDLKPKELCEGDIGEVFNHPYNEQFTHTIEEPQKVCTKQIKVRELVPE